MRVLPPRYGLESAGRPYQAAWAPEVRLKLVFRTGAEQGRGIGLKDSGYLGTAFSVHSSERWITRLAGRGRPRRTARRNVNRRTNRTSTRRTHMAPAETTLRRFARSRVGILCTGVPFPGNLSSPVLKTHRGIGSRRRPLRGKIAPRPSKDESVGPAFGSLTERDLRQTSGPTRQRIILLRR